MAAKKANAGTWTPGRSGNPKGRPKGTGTVANLRAAIERDIPAILKALVMKAREGDAAAARLLLERTVPPLRPTELPVPIALSGESLADQGRSVITAAAAGQLAPGQLAQVLGGLASLAKLVEADELERRIAALEAKSGGNPR